MAQRQPIVLVAVGAVLISFAPPLVKLAGAAGVGPSAIGVWRCLIGAALLFGGLKVRGDRLVPPRPTLVMSMAAGVAFAADLFAWHRAVLLVGAGMSTILGNTQVFWTSIVGRVAYREPLSRRFVVAAVTAFAGVVLLAGVGSNVRFSGQHLSGVTLALATGVLYATYLLVLRRASKRDGSDTPPLVEATRVLAWVCLTCGVVLAVSTVIEGNDVLPPSAKAWGLLTTLAVVAQVLGWISITAGLRAGAVSRASLVLLLQPALAMVWGVLFLSEHLARFQVLGAVLTLGAVYYGGRRS